ncbi:hypothetical protein SDC9_122536 [bioreactor metagenome]|uniref:histidinol-phosphatase n=1 Tax=bioreactor metagenome TaxID=1076179 RepID=A0A645CF69_9ZZZZ|nr:histidinol-phosphatase HisJ family protein [Christensenella sp.]
MFRQNLHTHSVWDDGQNTQEEMVQAARKAGLTSLGFSIHSYLPFAAEWTLLPERLPAYTRAMQTLKKTHADEIAIYFGIEWDILSKSDLAVFDYVIGSIHQISIQDRDDCVDASPERTADYLLNVFRGDADAAAEAYFSQYASLAKVDEVDIVGHFDLLTKFDEQGVFYKADSPRFLSAALAAMESLVFAGKIFEINTGAISRGYRTTPYPSRALLQALRRMGGRITISSDSHSADSVAYGFDAAERLALDCGYTEAWMFDGTAFVPVTIG